jgi:hypothetical protein
MANTTNDTKLCYKYLLNYLEKLKKQFNQCQLQLTKQSQLCPITRVSLNQIDRCLKEYVQGERTYLSKRNNNQLIKFKDGIYEKDLCKTIATYRLTMNLVSVYNMYILANEKVLFAFSE